MQAIGCNDIHGNSSPRIDDTQGARKFLPRRTHRQPAIDAKLVRIPVTVSEATCHGARTRKDRWDAEAFKNDVGNKGAGDRTGHIGDPHLIRSRRTMQGIAQCPGKIMIPMQGMPGPDLSLRR